MIRQLIYRTEVPEPIALEVEADIAIGDGSLLRDTPAKVRLIARNTVYRGTLLHHDDDDEPLAMNLIAWETLGRIAWDHSRTDLFRGNGAFARYITIHGAGWSVPIKLALYGERKVPMGYSARSTDTKVRIPSHLVSVALRALHDFARKAVSNGKPLLAYCDWGKVLERSDLRDALAELMWETQYDAHGDLFFRCFLGEKVGDDEHIGLRVIAPFVEPGSVIYMSGEDGYRWRYRFHGYAAADNGQPAMVEEEVQPTWVPRRRDEPPSDDEREAIREHLRSKLTPEQRKLMGLDP